MEIQKIITDNPLVDELVYYTKVLGFDTLLKDEDEASKYETLETLKASDIYIACIDGSASLYLFDYSIEDLVTVGIDRSNPLINDYLNRSDLIPEPYKTNLLNLLVERYKNNYEEKNTYYRMLSGQPEFIEKFLPTAYHTVVGNNIDISKPLHKYSDSEVEYLEELGILDSVLATTNSIFRTWDEKVAGKVTNHKKICYKEWLYIPEDFVEAVEEYQISAQLPLHYYSESEIVILEFLGVIEYFKENYPDKKYVNYLHSKKIDPYVARKTDKFGILYIPSIQVPEIYNNYYDRLIINRDFVLRTVYSEAYKVKSEHYNNFIALYIIILTMTDMIMSASDYIIKRDLFDMRSIRYLLESYGIQFYSDIPLRYQQKIIKNLNLLLKYKSSPKCMEIISSLFDVDDISIYRYFLVKTRVLDGDGNFHFTDPTNIKLFHESNDGKNYSGVYELMDKEAETFQRRWSTLNNDGSIMAMIYRTDEGIWTLEDYETKEVIAIITDAEDPVGDWILTSDNFETVYSRFTDTEVDDYDLHFCKVLLNDNIEDYIRNDDFYKDYNSVVGTDPYWNADKDHLVVLNTIMQEKFNFVRSKYFSIDIVYDLSEIAIQRPYMFGMLFDQDERPGTVRIIVDKISSSRSFRLNDLICYLMSLSFKFYGIADTIPYNRVPIMHITGFDFESDITYLQNYLIDHEIDDLSLAGFIPSGSYPTFDVLMEYYTKNVDIREELVKRMNEADNKRIYNIYKNIYDALMVQTDNNRLFKDENGNQYRTYQEFVEDRDPILGTSLQEIDAIVDENDRISTISDIMTEAVEAIQVQTIYSDEIKYVFSNFGSVSYESISTYIKHLIEFFKSFTAQMAELNSIYKISTPFDNKLSPIDDFHEFISKFTKTSVLEVRDQINQMTSTHHTEDKISLIERVYIEPTYNN